MKTKLLLCLSIIALTLASCAKEEGQPTVAVTGVAISPESLSIAVGEQKSLTATISPKDATNKKVRFSSSKESVATVSQDGIVEAVAVGDAIVTVTSEDGSYKAHCQVTVVDKVIHVTGVTISPESLSIELGEQKTLTATVSPENATNKNIKFSSSKESVVTVSQDGIVEGVALGNAIVTVTTDDGGYKATCSVMVMEKVIHVTGVSLNKSTLSMKEGDEYTLVPTVTPENAADKSVKWSSDNEAIVTVSSEGVVKALKAGNAKVTVTTVDGGKTACCSVEVAEGMGVTSGEASHISCRNAEISGKVKLPSKMTTDLSFGILYSTSPGVLIGSSTQIQATSYDQNFNFTVNTDVLEPQTTYYYRGYITQAGEVIYGEEKTFKTLAASSMIQTSDATDINPKDAILNAVLDLTDCKYDALEYGFTVTKEDGTTHTVMSSNLSENKFSAKDETLSKETKYSYVAYVTLDGRKYTGELKTFTTASIQASITAEASDVKHSTAIISGVLTVISKGTFSQSATLYHSSTESTLEGLKSNGNKQSISLNSDGTYTVKASGLKFNSKNYYCVVALVDEVEFSSTVKDLTTKEIPETVDLGLSVKWRSRNVGASKPEEYGTYFAWGDVTGQTWNGSSWSGGGFSTYPTYELDANNNLKPEYDAAYVNLGGSWRMPTYAEQQELINNCTSTWTSDYNGTGVAGRIFTSNKEGYTDQFIFLPAAGYGNGGSLGYGGSGGRYWSATFRGGNYAWDLYFYSDLVNTYGNSRSRGRSVRPVSEY